MCVGIWCRIQAGHAGGTLHNMSGWPRAFASEGLRRLKGVRCTQLQTFNFTPGELNAALDRHFFAISERY